MKCCYILTQSIRAALSIFHTRNIYGVNSLHKHKHTNLGKVASSITHWKFIPRLIEVYI